LNDHGEFWFWGGDKRKKNISDIPLHKWQLALPHMEGDASTLPMLSWKLSFGCLEKLHALLENSEHLTCYTR